uniref:Uncharacterized protein n=1 Tax=viral metagenome TaxID=1070528 RepID=A0A6M3LUF7_9ZZZZ
MEGEKMRILDVDVLLDRIEHLMERATTNVAMMLGLGLPGAAAAFGRQVILYKIFHEMVEDLAFDDEDDEPDA